MWKRRLWTEKIESAWKEKNVIWLAGVRRAGKTTLCRSIPDVSYFDCELPRVRQMMEDPEAFLAEQKKGGPLALDEIHRLENPSELLKIAADYFPKLKIIATGSSTLGASKKFKDTLTDRKINLWIPPMGEEDRKDFGEIPLKKRLLRGGLPPFILSKNEPTSAFQDWMDSYWAKDIQELFRLERRHALMKLFELLTINSGGIFEANNYATPCEISRATVSNYLKVLESTYTVNIVRPFSQNKNREIVSAPKVYSFDTGFVAYFRGWEKLRPADLGILWEHYVLNELLLLSNRSAIQYWRDKRGHEIDFIYPSRTKEISAIECKWRAKEFNPKNLSPFRSLYPKGENYIVASDIDAPYTKTIKSLRIRFLPLTQVQTILSNRSSL